MDYRLDKEYLLDDNIFVDSLIDKKDTTFKLKEETCILLEKQAIQVSYWLVVGFL